MLPASQGYNMHLALCAFVIPEFLIWLYLEVLYIHMRVPKSCIKFFQASLALPQLKN